MSYRIHRQMNVGQGRHFLLKIFLHFTVKRDSLLLNAALYYQDSGLPQWIAAITCAKHQRLLIARNVPVLYYQKTFDCGTVKSNL